MVDSIKPTNPSVPVKAISEQGIPNTKNPDASTDGGYSIPTYGRKLFVERRKSKDRRQSSSNRAMFDMRSSRGRRKCDHDHPSIETKA